VHPENGIGAAPDGELHVRARNLKPSLFMNEVLGAADPLYTLLFEGLWCSADREGRLEDRPQRLRAEIFPYRPSVDIEAALEWLKNTDFIDRYEVGGIRFIQVCKFSDHQRPHVNEVASVIPTKVASTSNQGRKRTQPKRCKGAKHFALTPDSGLLTPDSLNHDAPLAPLVPGLNLEAWKRFEEYRRNRKPAIKAISRDAAARKLASFGEQQMAVVENTVAEGYQGLVAPKPLPYLNGRGTAPPKRVPKTADEIEAEEAARAEH
jgi:hypothetical protein